MTPSTAEGKRFSWAITSLSLAVMKPVLTPSFQLIMKGQPFSILRSRLFDEDARGASKKDDAGDLSKEHQGRGRK